MAQRYRGFTSNSLDLAYVIYAFCFFPLITKFDKLPSVLITIIF